jgi:hypothetical protein
MQAFGTGMRDELIEHGAKEEEVLDGDLIMSMCNCGHEEFLKELLVRPKIKKPGKLMIPLILIYSETSYIPLRCVTGGALVLITFMLVEQLSCSDNF